MASAERWLFRRMWHLRLFLILLLLAGQNSAVEDQNDTKASLKNAIAPTNSTESHPASVQLPVKSEPNKVGSDALNNGEKLVTEVVTSTTKTPKELVANQTQTNAAENITIVRPSMTNSAVNNTAKVSPTIATKEPVFQSEDTKMQPKISTKTEGIPTLPVKSTENKPEPVEPPLPESPVASVTEPPLVKGTSKKVTQAPFLNTLKDVDDIDDNENPPLNDVDTGIYTNNDDTDNVNDIPPKGDDTEIEPPGEEKDDENIATKDESKPQMYHPKHAIGSDDFDDSDSHFFVYFMTVVGMCIVMYVLFHNKQKILALIVEGRQERRRRPNTSQYRPLDNNLEEVIQAGTPKNGRLTTNIIY